MGPQFGGGAKPGNAGKTHLCIQLVEVLGRLIRHGSGSPAAVGRYYHT